MVNNNFSAKNRNACKDRSGCQIPDFFSKLLPWLSMRVCTILKGDQHLVAVQTSDSTLAVLEPATFGLRSALQLIAGGAAVQTEIQAAINNRQLKQIDIDSVRLAPPIVRPPKIICVGKNYSSHAQEMGGSAPTLPVIFSKFSSAVCGHRDAVVLPLITEKVDFEAELVVVIGTPGKFIDRGRALEHVFGYTCGNDISARDWQKEKPGGQWLLGKTFDTFAPVGPCIVTAEEVPDPQNLKVQMLLNGEVMQDQSTADMIFPIDELIAHISQFVTLEVGDLIFTGTPSGVGAARTPPRFLKRGDDLEVRIESVGALKNPVT